MCKCFRHGLKVRPRIHGAVRRQAETAFFIGRGYGVYGRNYVNLSLTLMSSLIRLDLVRQDERRRCQFDSMSEQILQG
jgi:hypothetical protein